MSDANKKQYGGSHYQSGLQHWDIAGEFYGVAYHINCATKYISRWKKKGTPLLDLQKALHFTEKTIELVNAGAGSPGFVDTDVIERFVIANDLEMQERVALLSLWQFQSVEKLERAKEAIQALIREFELGQGRKV